MSAREMSGGCQCGRVRYRAMVDPQEAYLCHCRMCQRATGGFAASFVSVPLDTMAWEREADWYDSSPIAQRPFCAECGTPLGFRFTEDATKMDLTVGSFDDPADFRPAHHFGAESMIHESWLETSALPCIRTEEHKPLVDKWVKAEGRQPD
ncbi:GFA family protein [Altererythrobacter sp. CAU 1778]